MPPPPLEAARLLAALFDDRVSSAGGDPKAPQSPLSPAEEEALGRDASELRRLEFRNGRAAAHAAIRQLRGGLDEPILVGRNREPLWPAGIVGSISHTDSFCAAVAARQSDYAAIGLDVEVDVPLGEEFARRVCSPSELARCAKLGGVARGALVVFSVKECVYKLQYPLSQTVLYWRDLEVTLGDRYFSAHFLTACPPYRMGKAVTGRWVRGAGLILSGAAIEAHALETT